MIREDEVFRGLPYWEYVAWLRAGKPSFKRWMATRERRLARWSRPRSIRRQRELGRRARKLCLHFLVSQLSFTEASVMERSWL